MLTLSVVELWDTDRIPAFGLAVPRRQVVEFVQYSRWVVPAAVVGACACVGKEPADRQAGTDPERVTSSGFVRRNFGVKQ